jgi:hypothetical protein
MHCELKNSLARGAPDKFQNKPSMNLKITTQQLLLIILATALLFVAAFSFYLLQNPTAPLPFSAPPSSTRAVYTEVNISIPAPSSTPIPTRQTSYTPFATLLTLTPQNGTQSGSLTETVVPGGSISPTNPGNTLRPSPSGTLLSSLTSTSPSITASPTVTGTLALGEHGVTGRILQNGTPVANVLVEFEDDTSSRQSSTDSSGHYWFTTLAPGTSFSLTFNQTDNPNLTPSDQISSLAWFEGSLPTGVQVIDFPDFEISTYLNGMIYGLQTPISGAAYPAAAITSSYPIPFSWTLYSLGGSYHVELIDYNTNELVWSSNQLASTSYLWDGTLNDGTHITEGTYYWRVAVTRSLGNYVVKIFTQEWYLIFN